MQDTLSSTSKAPIRIESLTGARFLAAAWVLIMHFAVVGALGPRDASAHGWWLEFWIATGGASVGFFFVLSGFVLAHTYAHLVSSLDPQTLRRRFWRARVLRIYPTYLLALLLTTGSALWLGYLGASPWHECRFATCSRAWLLSAIPLQAWFPDATVQQLWNAPGWSIAVEAFFYALFPFFLLSLLALARRWRWRAVAVLWLLQNSAFAALQAVIASTADSATQEGLRWWLERLPLLRLPEFALGIVAWAIWQGERRAPAAPQRSAWFFWLLVVALSGLWFLPVPATPGWLHLLASGKAYSLVPPLFALLIIHLAHASTGVPHLAARVLATRPLVLLGEASYALYILHWCVLQSLFALYRSSGGSPPIWAGYAALVFAVALSIAVHLGLERPLRRVLRREPGPPPA